ncbi:MAG: hypothetical protein HC912_13165 [Saprospiraceae bacterium]|nr:hypothetical protein [Saprospiraceae bacterium]
MQQFNHILKEIWQAFTNIKEYPVDKDNTDYFAIENSISTLKRQSLGKKKSKP